MTTTAAGGILGFGPQAAKGVSVVDGNWYRHKAPQLSIGVADGQTVGPQEVGGLPVPSTPYKTGVSVGGSAVIYPRLENSFGYLLYSALGYQKSHEAAVNFIGVMDKKLLTSAAQTVTTGVTQPPTASKIAVRVWKGDNQSFTGQVVVAGKDGANASITETYDYSTGAGTSQRSVGLTSKETIVGEKTFASITSITLPAVALSDVYVSVGWEDTVARANVFTFDPLHPSRMKWIGVRKFVPGGDDDAEDYGFGETYNDCKVLGLDFTLPNNDLVSSNLSILGRTFSYEQDPAWGVASGDASGSWNTNGEFEGYESIPIGCQTAGYLTIPAFDGLELTIINGRITIANQPIDARFERVFGSPYLQGITVGSRSVALNISCLLKQDLYRQIITGSKLGTSWNPIPFTTRVDAMAESPAYISGAYTKYGIRTEISKAMLALVGTIPLVGNQAVVMQFSGIAIANSADYCQFTLTNKVDGYTWPS